MRAVAAAHAGAVPGRRVEPRPRFRRAAHAECVFINGPSAKVVAPQVADLRRRAAAHGRDPGDLLIFTLCTVITGRSEAEARAKHEEYRRYADPEAALALFSGWTGVDFSRFRPDEELRYIETEAMRSALASFTSDDPDRVWTVRELAEHVAIGGRGPLFVGSPEQIADTLIEWVRETDVDGFNLAYAVTPESFEDFVDLVVPELTAARRLQDANTDPAPTGKSCSAPARISRRRIRRRASGRRVRGEIPCWQGTAMSGPRDGVRCELK